jgi:hypothetical protein
MAIATTKTMIANMAFSFLKVDAVTNIDPPDVNSKAAKLASRWYDECRRECLSETIWDFAKRRVTLAAAGTPPAFGHYGQRFLLPADYIRVAFIGDETNPETDYEIEEGYILSNLAAPLPLAYIFDQEDIIKFSPKFNSLLAKNMARKMAYDLTGNRTMVEQMNADYENALSEAKGLDAQQNPPKRIQRSRWAMAKQVGHTGLYSDYNIRVRT